MTTTVIFLDGPVQGIVCAVPGQLGIGDRYYCQSIDRPKRPAMPYNPEACPVVMGKITTHVYRLVGWEPDTRYGQMKLETSIEEVPANG